MKLIVSKNKTLYDIQAQFNAYYPYLKLEFLRKNKNDSMGAPKLNDTSRLMDISPSMHDGEIDLNDSLTVDQIEKDLGTLIGLEAQVYRKSGNIWLATTLTDNWTLKGQNTHGREITLGH
jgi:hypothetical protein